MTSIYVHPPTIESNEAEIGRSEPASLAIPGVLDVKTSSVLERMFRDPRVLEPQERVDLITSLRRAVVLAPGIPQLRVLLGMALCVDLQAQEAMEELRAAVDQSPDCFIARLKFGELLMRLRICDQAAEHTHRAAQLSSNPMQSDLARRQAATIRTMQREGIERGGYAGFFSRLIKPRKQRAQQRELPILAATE